MHTRMPRFGMDNVGHLVAAFDALDKIEAVPVPRFAETTNRVKAEGRHLVGDKAFGCIKCHTFNTLKAEGIQAMDLAVMTQRLKRDWFHRYLTNPFTYRPGTRMPSPFPGGQTLLANVLEGDAAKQSEAVWLFLEDGSKAAIPPGIIKNAIPLVPTKEAIIYRNFIQGAGSRAIAVGYPEKAHLAFDANQLRLALIWQGAFIDASKHWTDRGVGYQTPLGDAVVTLPTGPAFARLTSEADPWPKDTDKDKDHFRGYRLTKDQRPTFIYEVGGLVVEDFPNAVAGEKSPGFKRELTVTTKDAVNNLYFRAAVADVIEPLKDGWFAVGKEMRVRLPGGIVRESAGKKELILLVKFKDGKATVTQELAW
jgi:hypothetical protein